MLSLPQRLKVSTNTRYGGIILDMRNQVAFAKPEASDSCSQRCEGAVIPTVPFGISEVSSSTHDANVH